MLDAVKRYLILLSSDADQHLAGRFESVWALKLTELSFDLSPCLLALRRAELVHQMPQARERIHRHSDGLDGRRIDCSGRYHMRDYIGEATRSERLLENSGVS